MADIVERVTNLLALLLETRQPLTMTQIVGSLEGQYPRSATAQRATFERDKALLRELGVPIKSQVLGGAEAGQTAYWVDRRDYELQALDLTDDERHALQVAAAAVRSNDAQFGLLKLGGSVTGQPTLRLDMPTLDALPELHRAARGRHEVTFDYRESPRRVHPYALLLRAGSWYLIGVDPDKQAMRTFRVDRMSAIGVVEPAHAFERPAGFDPRQELPLDPKEIGGDATAVVRVDPEAAERAVAGLGPASVLERRADGSVDVRVPCANPEAFRAWLFDLDHQAVVISPDHVRAAVMDWLRSLVAT
jgi:predicted DNA-binding transcriptional regulator YafY